MGLPWRAELSTIADDALDTCTARSVEGSTCRIVENNWPPLDEPASGIPSVVKGQTLSWDEPPDGRFYGILVNDADQAAYDRIVMFPVWKSASPGRKVDMIPGELGTERFPWWVRITFQDEILDNDAYFFPAGEEYPPAMPLLPATPAN